MLNIVLTILSFFNIYIHNIVNYNVIHISENNNIRKNNIIKMSNKLNKDIKIFEAIKITNTTNILYYDKNIKFNFTYKFINEVGCYLSHLLLIKSLINSKYKFSVIFEDDFYLKNNNFENELNKILNKLSSFDILYLGNLHNNHGSHYIDNIYNINYKQPLWGTYGYLINNKSAKKIYNNLLNLNNTIDSKLKNLIDNKILKAYIIYPVIVDVIYDKSTIRSYYSTINLMIHIIISKFMFDN